MTTEERLKRIEDKLGMSWGCREPKFHMVDQFAPKRATIKIGPMHPIYSNEIVEVLDGVPGIRVDRGIQHTTHRGPAGTLTDTKHTLTITGPAQ